MSEVKRRDTISKGLRADIFRKQLINKESYSKNDIIYGTGKIYKFVDGSTSDDESLKDDDYTIKIDKVSFPTLNENAYNILYNYGSSNGEYNLNYSYINSSNFFESNYKNVIDCVYENKNSISPKTYAEFSKYGQMYTNGFLDEYTNTWWFKYINRDTYYSEWSIKKLSAGSFVKPVYYNIGTHSFEPTKAKSMNALSLVRIIDEYDDEYTYQYIIVDIPFKTSLAKAKIENTTDINSVLDTWMAVDASIRCTVLFHWVGEYSETRYYYDAILEYMGGGYYQLHPVGFVPNSGFFAEYFNTNFHITDFWLDYEGRSDVYDTFGIMGEGEVHHE